MSASQPGDELAAHLVDVLAPLGDVAVARFFGGQSLKLRGAQFAFIIKGEVYLRAGKQLRAELESLGSRAFSYQTKRKEVRVASYWSVPDAQLDDEPTLLRWARSAVTDARAAAK